MSRIEPRTLKGFRDLFFGPARRRESMVARATAAFRRFGYLPIETPALEYAEILEGKGGEESDKQLYAFDDAGGRRVALRFDLTVPLARFVAEHHGRLAFPFRRYHVAPVWRGERPQKGRFREFVQCDADLVGATGEAADAEMLVVLDAAYREIDEGAVHLRVNDRRVLEGLLDRLGASEIAVPVLRALDKLDKRGADAVLAEMSAAGLPSADARRLLDLAVPGTSDDETLLALGRAVEGSLRGEAGVESLRRVRVLAVAGGVEPGTLTIDPRIARGLDYYTGIVFEATLADRSDFGSVGGGGRYDDLAGLYTKERLPGVGGSVGIDRLLAAIEDREGDSSEPAPCDVMVAHPGAERLPRAFALAAALRGASYAVEVFPEERKHAAQMRYADRRRIRFVLTLDDDGTVHGKDLVEGGTFDAADAPGVAHALASRHEVPPPG